MNQPKITQSLYSKRDSCELSAWISAKLKEAVADAPLALKHISESHFATEGKRLRGRMAFEAARLFGADFDTAVTWAAAVELLHDASLIHDDLCDRDVQRRGRKTVYSQYGSALAVCLGDYYISTAFRLAALAGVETVPMLCDAMATSSGGQAAEFQIEGYPAWARYCEIAVGKTSPLLSLPIIGAAVLTHHTIDQNLLKSYFANAATCFQIINDLENYSAAGSQGEPCSDLAKCRPNALLSLFRDSLPAHLQQRFDNWSNRVSAGEAPEPAELLQWWQRIGVSDALLSTRYQLRLHFKCSGDALQLLQTEIRLMLAQFHEWLAYEVGESSVSTAATVESAP
jgi:geranylgeranyl pyrophosphate synthase